MRNVASVGRSFPSLSDSGNLSVGFLRKWIELSLVIPFGMIFYPPSHPPTREGNWSHCSEYLSWLDGRVELLLWLSLDSSSWGRKVGRGSSGYSWVMVQKFFNRSPITLKFGGPKIRERESRKRERERALVELVVILTLVSCCCFTLVSCYYILISCHFYVL